jgi:hypothetical protein
LFLFFVFVLFCFFFSKKTLRYCDALLRKGKAKTEAGDLDAKLRSIITIFKYLDDKDVFQKVRKEKNRRTRLNFFCAVLWEVSCSTSDSWNECLGRFGSWRVVPFEANLRIRVEKREKKN